MQKGSARAWPARVPGRRRASLLLSLCICAAALSFPASAGAEEKGPLEVASLSGGERFPLSARPPDAGGDPEVAVLWSRGLRYEAEHDFLASSSAWETVARKRPNASHTYWRIARNYIRYAHQIPPANREEQLRYYSLTEEWAERGLAVDPDCGECYLYKFAGLGRRLALGSVVSAARRAAQLAKLLDRAIALRPVYRDNEWNSELGNLYYAAAAFYRVLPEWRWLEWVIGVRGDKRRSLEYIRRANAISNDRIDYHLALGATLLCVGVDKDEPDLLSEGVDVLHHVSGLPIHLETDANDRRIAEALLRQPERACGYTHHDWIDIDAELKRG